MITIIINNIIIIIDDEVDSWTFMSTPWPVISIISIYLLFILKVGPYIMKTRKPMNVKYVMLLYNAVQTIFNGWLVAWVRFNFFLF